MKVVHIFKDFYPPTTGGIEQHMRLLCGELARNLDVVVLVPSRSRRTIDETVDGVRVIRVPEFGRYASTPLCPTAPWTLRSLRPDLVHIHFPNPMGDLTYLLSGVRAPLVVSYHADIVKQRTYLPYYLPVVRRLLDRAQRIVVASDEYVSSSDLLRTYSKKTTIIPYGVDRSSYALKNGDHEAVAALQREIAPFVLFVGALRYYKGVDVLIRAMARVKGHAVIVGRGDTAELRNLAVELGIENRIRFLGEISDAKLRVLFHAANAVVLPSIDRCEAFGIALVEAMTCGKPIISTGIHHENTQSG